MTASASSRKLKDEVIEQFDVTREQIAAVLDFVAQSLRASDVHAGAHPL